MSRNHAPLFHAWRERQRPGMTTEDAYYLGADTMLQLIANNFAPPLPGPVTDEAKQRELLHDIMAEVRSHMRAKEAAA